ncbi:SEL1-like repeat protein [Granulicella aggregans]|uniref:hypothetical protein n=1 Tax=Granulicella aggregans TaxID=474949 RepID=UPI0021E0FA1D|nr:hypothetical protein [Granulicella aggregans]
MLFPRTFLSVAIVTATIGVNLTSVAQTSDSTSSKPYEQAYQREKAEQEKRGANPDAGLNLGGVYYNNAPPKAEKPCVPRPKPSASADKDSNPSNHVQAGPSLPYDDTYCPEPVDIDAIIAKAKKTEADRVARQRAEASATTSAPAISVGKSCPEATASDNVDALYADALNAFDKGNLALAECIAKGGAVLGDRRELTLLGVIYTEGNNPARDPVRGFHYFLDAAKQGEPFGQMHLSECFVNSIGTDFNLEAAWYWSDKAREDPEVRALLDKNIQAMNGAYQEEHDEDQRIKQSRYNEIQSGQSFGSACVDGRGCVSRPRAPAGYHQPH